MRPARRALAGTACCLLATLAPADTISLGWQPVDHPGLTGYRIRVRNVETGQMRTEDVQASATNAMLGLLEGNCAQYCATVSSVDEDGATSPPSAELCGIADPEIFDVAETDLGWVVLGDNFSEQAQVLLDGGDDPLDIIWIDCGHLLIPLPPLDSLRVFDPGLGVGTTWTVPLAGYYEDPSDHEQSILLECRTVGDNPQATVTALSHTPGLGLEIEADGTGIGTPCAVAIERVLALQGIGTQEMTVLPLGPDATAGFLYVFAD